MRKVLLSAGMLVGITATAQETGYEKRVGINTETPRASFEVKATNNGKAQGILFPHISEEEKAKWAKDNNKGLVAGTVIWNTTKICLDYFDGTNWQCTDGTKPNVHPTPWTSTPTPPPATTYTGTAIWGDTAGETITATKNNCPSGQNGSSVTYPANNTQHITYTATSTVSQAEANQKALDLMNSSTEVAKRQQLAQDYANANGTCTTLAYKYADDRCLPNAYVYGTKSNYPFVIEANKEGRVIGSKTYEARDFNSRDLLEYLASLGRGIESVKIKYVEPYNFREVSHGTSMTYYTSVGYSGQYASVAYIDNEAQCKKYLETFNGACSRKTRAANTSYGTNYLVNVREAEKTCAVVEK